jgi:hypothetical protein
LAWRLLPRILQLFLQLFEFDFDGNDFRHIDLLLALVAKNSAGDLVTEGVYQWMYAANIHGDVVCIDLVQVHASPNVDVARDPQDAFRAKLIVAKCVVYIAIYNYLFHRLSLAAS